jgi:hypothetical protein
MEHGWSGRRHRLRVRVEINYKNQISVYEPQREDVASRLGTAPSKGMVRVSAKWLTPHGHRVATRVHAILVAGGA